MAWTREQKGLQRDKFKQWKAKNVTNQMTVFRAPKHAAGKGQNFRSRVPLGSRDECGCGRPRNLARF